MKLTVKCPQCEQTFTKEFDDLKVLKYMQGGHPQDIFPEISPEDRELFFISHICSKCWDDLFGVEDVEFENI